MSKTIWVETNDPVTQKHKLMISGFVEKIVDIQPKGLVRLLGNTGTSIKKTITIIPEKKYPFKITEAKALKGEDIKFEFKEIESDRIQYQLTVENIKATQGRYFDTISLKTTSTLMPEISMRIFGDIRDPKINANKNMTNEQN